MKKIVVGLVIIILALGAATAGLYFWYKSGGLEKTIIRTMSEHVTSNKSEVNLIQEILGYNNPRTYLLLFLNNTELRPGGGFIGAYAVVRVDKGIPQILKVEGTEILDNYAPQDKLPIPPAPLAKYLYIKKWGFRDSNWSPDFAESSLNSMNLFKIENGTAADSIDSVIGFTPTVLENILKISGPITVDGEEFTPENFTQKLEYEVEYGYAQKGLEFNDRKQILANLSRVLLQRLRTDVVLHWADYLNLAQQMLTQKQIVAYSSYPEAENVLLAKDWAGEIKQVPSDYLMWVDANLAALKTDKAMERTLSYLIAPSPSSTDKFIGTVKMTYTNTGHFDKFTTRYRTYARVYLPLGSKFISVEGSMRNDRTTDVGTVDQGMENGKQWFGTFIAIEPGQTKDLTWQFELAPKIVSQINANTYQLFVQKQIGTLGHKLTLHLNFGKTVFTKESDLIVDREF
ncbi:MAG: DUF4012 domain-containing protein [Patescibacteria group bacterium]